jgi:uncharacterized membrane protein YhaH (DUF805 family)
MECATLWVQLGKRVGKRYLSTSLWNGYMADTPKQTEPVTQPGGWTWVFFGTRGKLDRQRFFVAGIIIGTFYYLIASKILSYYYDATYLELPEYPLVALLVYLLIVWPNYATVSKRIADTGGKPSAAWGYVFIVLIPIVGVIMQIIWWIILVLTPGKEEPSKHIPEPSPSPQGMDEVTTPKVDLGPYLDVAKDYGFLEDWNEVQLEEAIEHLYAGRDKEMSPLSSPELIIRSIEDILVTSFTYGFFAMEGYSVEEIIASLNDCLRIFNLILTPPNSLPSSDAKDEIVHKKIQLPEMDVLRAYEKDIMGLIKHINTILSEHGIIILGRGRSEPTDQGPWEFLVIRKLAADRLIKDGRSSFRRL